MLIVKRLLAKKIIRQCVYVYEHGTKFPNSEIQSDQFEHEREVIPMQILYLIQ